MLCRPGEKDTIDVTTIKDMDYVIKSEHEVNSLSIKTAWGFKLKRNTYPTSLLQVAFRFRWVAVGKCLKPTKPYIVTTKRFFVTAKCTTPHYVTSYELASVVITAREDF
jgi:hypothetical protein